MSAAKASLRRRDNGEIDDCGVHVLVDYCLDDVAKSQAHGDWAGKHGFLSVLGDIDVVVAFRNRQLNRIKRSPTVCGRWLNASFAGEWRVSPLKIGT